MPIEPEVEEPARDLLGYAIRGEFDEYADAMADIGAQRYVDARDLCLRLSGYVVIDACGREWPTDTDLRRVAELLGQAEMKFDLEEGDVYEYLARTVLGFEPLSDVFTDNEKAATVPFFATAALLVAYRPQGTDWWEYLDIVEQALEDAEPIADELAEETLPALLLLTRRAQARKGAT